MPFVNGFKEKEMFVKWFKERFYFGKGRQFPDEFVSFFVCFSFQTKIDLALVTFCDKEVWRFLKSFRKSTVKHPSWIQFLIKFQNGLSHRLFPLIFPNTFLKLLPNVEQKHVVINDNIVLCKDSRVIKDLSKSGALLLLGVPRYLEERRMGIAANSPFLI